MRTGGDGSQPQAERLVQIRGTVQGVGFRPLVARLAARCEVRGWVRNDAHGVLLRVAGQSQAVTAFLAALRGPQPPPVRISSFDERAVNAAADLPPLPEAGFVILASDVGGQPAAEVTPDLALCVDCRSELAQADDRRHGYPFINCTRCGPRYSILEALPYDRARTSMAVFTMCPDCQREFDDPQDRRYHAQPNACPVCGPEVELQDSAGHISARRSDAIAAAAIALRDGRIVAVKGLGGFHLLVDAANEEAVTRLRHRKQREEKPLAVMFPSIAALLDASSPGPDEREALESAAAPIVLVRRRAGATLAAGIAPGNPWIGALLPYTPLHVLLLQVFGRPVVATSGNLSEEPLCIRNDEARARLGSIADLFLVHNREIVRPIDDSVLRWGAGAPIVLRRARGLAPGPIPLPAGTPAAERLLCVGGHTHGAIAATVGDAVVLSPHLGDLENPVTRAAFRHAVELFGSLYGGRFTRVVCDAHPDYASSRFAEGLGLPVVRVQHHLAHVLACLLENDGGPARVLGVAWDGTGSGPDGTVWGGEFIVIDRAARRARRLARLRPFRLPGGEAAVREPRRSALGLLHELFGGDRSRLDPWVPRLGFTVTEAAVLFSTLDRGQHAPLTSSAGRLFDAVAALLGLRLRCGFEAQAAMAVEWAAERAAVVDAWPVPLERTGAGCWELDWRAAVFALLERHTLETERGKSPAAGGSSETDAATAALAASFHRTLAAAIVAVARASGIEAVALTGGCFQNARLLKLTTEALAAAGFAVLRHRQLPPGDGGLAAGQALGALWGITEVEA